MSQEKTKYEDDIEKQKQLFTYIQDKIHLTKESDIDDTILLQTYISAIIDGAENVNVKNILRNFYYGSSFKIDDKTFTYEPGTIPIIIPDTVNQLIEKELYNLAKLTNKDTTIGDENTDENETINITTKERDLRLIKEEFNGHSNNYIRVHNIEHLATILSLYDPDYLFFNDITFSNLKKLNLQLLEKMKKIKNNLDKSNSLLGGSKKIRSKPTIINDHRMRKYAIINDMKYQILNEIENGKLILCDSKNNIKVY
tara:strand:+ start:1151 stop:1915 length:765 start_codon:yes stop_codon:yes gene_type:complete